KTPIAAYRGAGRPEAIFLIERMIELAARELGIDPAEMRRRNLLPAFDEPTASISGELYDSGNYAVALERALSVAGYEQLRAEQQQARQAGRLMGIGIASYVEMAGFGPDGDLFESATVDIVVSDGQWRVRGVPGRSVTFVEIAKTAYGGARPKDIEAGLESTRFFQPPGMVFPFGAHVAVVEVDPETGAVGLRRYISVDDCGRVLNPLLVEG